MGELGPIIQNLYGGMPSTLPPTGTPLGRALPKYVWGDSAMGLKRPGNIDVNNRPTVRNPDGSVSTEYSMSIGTDQGEVLIPQIVRGQRVSPQSAIGHFRSTGEHLGVFGDKKSANKYANDLHNRFIE